jgi:hypothetical protein
MHHPKRDAQGEDWDLENTNHIGIQKKINTSIKKNRNKNEKQKQKKLQLCF